MTIPIAPITRDAASVHFTFQNGIWSLIYTRCTNVLKTSGANWEGINSSNSLDELLASTDLNPPHLTNLSQLVEIIYHVFKQETRRLEQSASPLCEGYVTPGEEEKACKDVLTNEEQLDRTKWNS